MNYFYIISILLFIIVCSATAYYYYQNYQKNVVNKNYKENKEFLNKVNSIDSEFYFFYTDWCPHCKNAKIVWEDIQKNIIFKDYKINYIKIDCDSKSNKEIVNEFNITEYPSYVLKIKDKKFVYDANLSPETLQIFLKAVYNKV